MVQKITFKSFLFSDFDAVETFVGTLTCNVGKRGKARSGICNFRDYVAEKFGTVENVMPEYYEAWREQLPTLVVKGEKTISRDTWSDWDNFTRRFSDYLANKNLPAEQIVKVATIDASNALKTPLDAIGTTWSNLINQYFDANAIRENTRQAYRYDLEGFFRDVYDATGITTPTTETLEQWNRVYMQTVSPSTAGKKITVIRNFFSWLNRRGLYSTKVDTLKVPRRREYEHKRDAVPAEKIREILALAKKESSPRNYLIFLLTVTCGLRANEVVNINISDIKEEEGRYLLYLLRKGRDDKNDFITIPPAVFNELRTFLRQRQNNEEQLTETTPLFVSAGYNNLGGRLSKRTLEEIANRYYCRVGLRDGLRGVTGRSKYTFHSLRHSCLTFAIENGASITEVQALAGHKNINTTMIYVHDLNKKNNKASAKAYEYIMKPNK